MLHLDRRRTPSTRSLQGQSPSDKVLMRYDTITTIYSPLFLFLTSVRASLLCSRMFLSFMLNLDLCFVIYSYPLLTVVLQWLGLFRMFREHRHDQQLL